MQVSTLETPLINTGGLMTNIILGAALNGSLQTQFLCTGITAQE